MRTMSLPFPTDPAARKAAHALMVAEAPDVMVELADLRKDFPSAKLAYIKTQSVEFGKLPDFSNAWPVSDELVQRVAAEERKRNPPPDVILQQKANKRRHAAIKRKT